MSKSMLGAHKISPSIELLPSIIFIGMFSLNIAFFLYKLMIFGSSDCAFDLRLNVGNDDFVSYFILRVVGFISLFN
jgi:hypothetical protein